MPSVTFHLILYYGCIYHLLYYVSDPWGKNISLLYLHISIMLRTVTTQGQASTSSNENDSIDMIIS